MKNRPVPEGFCPNMWDAELGIGPRHHCATDQVDKWEGFGADLPDEYVALALERYGDVSMAVFHRCSTTMHTCLNCGHTFMEQWMTNDGLALMVENVKVIELPEFPEN